MRQIELKANDLLVPIRGFYPEVSSEIVMWFQNILWIQANTGIRIKVLYRIEEYEAD